MILTSCPASWRLEASPEMYSATPPTGATPESSAVTSTIFLPMLCGLLQVHARQISSVRLLPATENDGGVVAAESKGVGHCVLHLLCTGCIGNEVEVAAGVGVVEIDGRRQDAFLERQRRGDDLDSACCAKQVADHRLRRRDRKL